MWEDGRFSEINKEINICFNHKQAMLDYGLLQTGFLKSEVAIQ